MPGRQLSPQDVQSKQIISEQLNQLLKKSGYLKKDVNEKTGIPNSTLSGYFNGTRLPTPENVEKLAKFFNVDKSDIDPRFSVKSSSTVTDADLDKALDKAHSFDGQPMDDHDRQIIKGLLKGYFENKN